MDVTTINEILSFYETDFRAEEKLPATGQREVFLATQISSSSRCVIKLCTVIPVNVARMQREIRILESIGSDYFPEFLFKAFVTDTTLEDFYDAFDTRQEAERQRIEELRAMKIKPFLLTVEEFIEHIGWDTCLPAFKDEQKLVDLLFQIFLALDLLWKAKIVHRDLKPENILIRPDLRPVIIDLGIAKSFREGTLDLTIPQYQSPCTPRYAAPEQLINSKTDITYKTDQFSVGMLAFLILTDRFPYGDEHETGIQQVAENMLAGHMENIRNLVTPVNEGLTLFIEKLLQPPPYKRFRNIDTILQRLTEIKESLA